MIKNIIFDIGNVVLTFHPKEHFSGAFSDPKLGEKICTMMMGGDVWKGYDLGIHTLEDVRLSCVQQCPQYRDEITTMLQSWTSILHPIDYTMEVMKQLRKQGYSIYLLSNLNKDAYEFIHEHYDIFHFVDGYVVSFQEGLAKPDLAIYECLVQRYHLQREECVFLDDLIENVEAAKEFGMEAIHFKTPAQVDVQLKALIGEYNA